MVTMKSLSYLLTSPPPLQNLPKATKPISQALNNPLQAKSLTHNEVPRSLQVSAKTHLSLAITQLLVSLPCFASEASLSNDAVSGKIDLESVLVSIDDFFNRNPFFVAGCTFIWLVIIPIAEFYLSKCKPIAAIDAFRKLKSEPNAQLLDIREEKTLVSLGSPNLKTLDKSTVQIQFSDGDEESFLKTVKERFPDPANTVVCVLDNFDGNSMKVAELLFKNGFKEVYAIKGGVRGQNGWLAIQETLLPPAVHIYPNKKVKKASEQLGVNGGVIQQTSDGNNKFSSENTTAAQSESMDYENPKLVQNAKTASRLSSPYPNYPDMKPPSSPTPSKP